MDAMSPWQVPSDSMLSKVMEEYESQRANVTQWAGHRGARLHVVWAGQAQELKVGHRLTGQWDGWWCIFFWGAWRV